MKTKTWSAAGHANPQGYARSTEFLKTKFIFSSHAEPGIEVDLITMLYKAVRYVRNHRAFGVRLSNGLEVGSFDDDILTWHVEELAPFWAIFCEVLAAESRDAVSELLTQMESAHAKYLELREYLAQNEHLRPTGQDPLAR